MSDEPREGTPGTPGPGPDARPGGPETVVAMEKASAPPPPTHPPPPESVAAPPPAPSSPPAPEPVVRLGARVANPTAIAAFMVGLVALVMGILPFAPLFGVLLGALAVVLGAIGISKVRRGATGRGVAITGIALGLLGLAAACLWWALSIAFRSTTAAPADLAMEAQQELDRIGTASPIDTLQTGNCLQNFVGGAEVTAAPVVPCALPHDYEVYAILDIAAPLGAPYPLLQQLRAAADGQCQADPFETYIGESYFTTRLVSFAAYPSEARWAAGDRTVLCLVSDPAGKVTGSLRGTGAVLPPQGPLQPPEPPTLIPRPVPAPGFPG